MRSESPTRKTILPGVQKQNYGEKQNISPENEAGLHRQRPGTHPEEAQRAASKRFMSGVWPEDGPGRMGLFDMYRKIEVTCPVLLTKS